MNGIEQAQDKIYKFIDSDKKSMLLTGTHQFKKHKLVMALLNKYYTNANILFRSNGMDNLTDYDFIGFAGLKKKPKSGERVRIGNNTYTFDSLNKGTWSRTGNNFDAAIVYPLDSAIKGNLNEIMNDIKIKNVKKLFLISWTDNKKYRYEDYSKYYQEHVIYDAFEEDEAYHKRVIDLINSF